MAPTSAWRAGPAAPLACSDPLRSCCCAGHAGPCGVLIGGMRRRSCTARKLARPLLRELGTVGRAGAAPLTERTDAMPFCAVSAGDWARIPSARSRSPLRMSLLVLVAECIISVQSAVQHVQYPATHGVASALGQRGCSLAVLAARMLQAAAPGDLPASAPALRLSGVSACAAGHYLQDRRPAAAQGRDPLLVSVRPPAPPRDPLVCTRCRATAVASFVRAAANTCWDRHCQHQ